MAFNFLPAERDQLYVMPPSLSDWLPKDHLAFCAVFQVLSLCAAAGLVKLGVVALDGTKIAANASGQVNRTRGELEHEAARIVAEAIAVDRAEDARYDDRRGDELPAEFADRS